MGDFFKETFSPVDQKVNILVLLIISLSNSSRRVLGTGLTLWQKREELCCGLITSRGIPMPNSIEQMAQTWVQCNCKVLGGILWGDLDCLGHCIGGGRL